MRFFQCFFIPAAMALPLASFSAAAATLCVSLTPSNGCYAHIAEAVAAAQPGDVIKVGPGTFHESVTITKPLSLTGSGTTLDATGLSRGFLVYGVPSPVSGVNISGFTVQNANFEGVLFANASAVSLSNSVITNNNHALTHGTCPGLEIYETNEQTDCGEGVHLMGVDHAIVTNNTIAGNSGGLLLSDDVGTTHDNLISFNTVYNNAYACGITMASHPAASITGSKVPLGVFHNTVYGNQSKANGLSNGGGSGIGIFASVPFAKSYGNVVVNNLVSGNGLPGIALHAHVPNQTLTDNMIVGNTVTDNAQDTEDAFTPGPTGINVYSAAPATGNIVSGNAIQSESYDVAVHVPVPVQVQFNALVGPKTGLLNMGTGAVIGANNWWGCPTGPTLAGTCSTASSFGGGLEVSPWLGSPVPSQPSF